MSNAGDQEHTMGEEAQVMLGFAEPVDLEEHGPLLAEDFCSKIGGFPLWLNPEHVLDTKEMLCDQCQKPMTFLLQLYSPEDHPAEAFHRVIYVFCCKNGACHKKSPRGCFKVVRSQLGQYNPYYTPVSEDGEDAAEENEGWEPFPSDKHAKTCFVCGMHGPKVCSKCHKVSYCGPEHQTIHWSKGLHKQLCGTNPPTSSPALDSEMADLSISSTKDKDDEDQEDEEEYDEDGNLIEKKKCKPLTQTLTKEQQEYANKLDIDYKLVERMNRFPELEIISEAEIFDQEAIEEGLVDESSGDEQEAEEGWEERAAALKAKREMKAAALAKKNGAGVSKSLETAESSMNALVPVGDEMYENTKTDIDAAFLTFQKRIALYPDQVLRYARMEYELTTPEPLYVSDIGIPKPEDIPACPDCGQERTFEFQIMPQLLSYLAIDHSAADSLDFGTVLVYSCKDNCHVENTYYQHEIALVQHFSEDGMQGGNMTSGPSVSVSSK
ncbi:Programmed cell death protein 2 [Entomortierella chlamydospora]|uniref:Programmed cell death protein 2 n=1 Tax=Entomortierella chlamydospora TaxID=101097 RepID=A0A9P6SZN6_9FUNG|nr:Programmed cell death protein 2 [Entomortierella chlamydospora]